MRRFITPNIKCSLAAAARRALPLSFGGQAVLVAITSAQPITVLDRFIPIHGHHRLVGMIEILVIPMLGRGVPRGLKENGVIAVANLASRQLESVHINTMDRAFLVLPRLASHHVFPRRD